MSFDEDEFDSDYECSNSKISKKSTHIHNPNGFGNVLQKILSQKADTILSRQPKQKSINKHKKIDKIDSTEDEILKDRKQLISKKISLKADWEEMGHIRDTLFDREKEKQLQRIATRGVVTLFNSVRKQQNIIESKLTDAKSVRAKEKITTDLSKSKFIDMLKSNNKCSVNNGNENWKVLQDDFLMQADLKDWGSPGSDSNENLKN